MYLHVHVMASLPLKTVVDNVQKTVWFLYWGNLNYPYAHTKKHLSK